MDGDGKPLKDKRPLVVKSLDHKQALLSRIEGKKEIDFSVERRDDDQKYLYYCEGKSVYKIHRPHGHDATTTTAAEDVPTGKREQQKEDDTWGYAERWEPEL